MLLDAEARQQLLMADVPMSANVITHQQVVTNVVNIKPLAYRPFSSTGAPCGRDHSSRIQCQLCGQTSHLVDRCYYHFDANYKSVFSQTLAPMTTSWSNPFNGMLLSVNDPTSPTYVLSSSPQAYVATLKTVGDNAWYPDSSATYHLIHSAAQ
ncbi:hypothetical protein J1N35_011055 [Gossypium stocksii]|uniref:Uncharacterized protein n=1 Tax=Gossypium stocksii TaxID=47602 RepID=A0A9D3W253_9ROSI|nr:hypothetical protein J1N35_011055 [Gossypium stocksii]